MLEFFKKNKVATVGVVVLLVAVAISMVVIARQKPEEAPIPLSQVAVAVSRGQVAKIEDSQEQGVVTVYYKDGTQKTARRDLNSSFLEQLKLLGVNESQLAQLRYEIAAPSKMTNDKAANIVATLAMLGM